jgi:vancomycin aglycone glucosyltransferase
MPAAASARSVTEKLGIRYVYASFQQLTLPSPHHPPLAYPGRPFPPEVTDNRVLWDLDARNINELFGAALNTHRVAIGLPPVDNVRDYVIGDQPWLATDPTLDPWQQPADLDVVQTGAWILPDVRLLPAELVAFLDAGTPPVYVGFGSMAMQTPALRAPKDIARVADLGIGAAHDGPTPTTESLSAALRTALTPETRARATAVAGAIRTDGATVAATLLLDAVSRKRPPVSA